MSRIKFKVFVKDTNIVFGYEELGPNFQNVFELGWVYSLAHAPNSWMQGVFDTEGLIRVQSTTYVDKHGKEIYDGDLLKFVTQSGASHIWEVFMDRGQWRIHRKDKETNDLSLFHALKTDQYEVIGSIFDIKIRS